MIFLNEQEENVNIDEEYREEDDSFMPQQADTDDLGMPPYSAEYFQNMFHLRNSPYHKSLVDTIMASRLSMKAKKTLINTANGYFDQTVFQSNLSGQQTGDKEVAELKLNIVMVLIEMSYKRSDRLKPELTNIEEVFKNHMDFVFSRAVGRERERLQQNKFTMGQEAENITRTDPEETKRRGFFGR